MAATKKKTTPRVFDTVDPYSAPETFYLSLKDMSLLSNNNNKISSAATVAAAATSNNNSNGFLYIPTSSLAVSDAFLQSVMWLVNYLIIAKVSRELQKTVSKEAYLASLSICLFVLVLIQTLMRDIGDINKNRPHSHRNRLIYLGFSILLLICIHVK